MDTAPDPHATPRPAPGQGLRTAPAAPSLSVVVPCYNERDNVVPMVQAVASVLSDRDWELIFVDDDSPDGTAALVRDLGEHDARIRCIRRFGRRGLSSAVIEGALSAAAPIVAVMDGDLQHDEAILPILADLVATDSCDIAVGSRHAEGGDTAGLETGLRIGISDAGIRLANLALPVRLADPMSGYFALRRSLFETLAPRLSSSGFKILLDLVLSSPARLRVHEVPFHFRARRAGNSKLDMLVMLQFASVLLDKTCRGMIPMRFLAFALVGLIGVGINLLILEIARASGLGFAASQTVATLIAMVSNFWLNNVLTYGSQRLRGTQLWRGLALFMIVCGIGGAADVGIAHMMYRAHSGWSIAGAAGAAIAVVWNYAVSSTLVWRTR